MNTPRVPPRFVPTLTTVLEPGEGRLIEPDTGGHDAVPSAPPYPLQAENVVATPAEPGHRIDAVPPAALPDLRHAIALDPATRLTEIESFALEEDLLHRVMQRIDLSLEDRLSDVVAAAVQVQLDAMVPRLREEIEGVLRTLVTEALAQELQEKPGSNPPGTDPSFG